MIKGRREAMTSREWRAATERTGPHAAMQLLREYDETCRSATQERKSLMLPL